jgi:hypothetical protein
MGKSQRSTLSKLEKQPASQSIQKRVTFDKTKAPLKQQAEKRAVSQIP